jgi:hypothetical protein
MRVKHGGAWWALLLAVAWVTAAAAAERPNVVFFLADDLGWRDTSLYGSTFYETPNVDRLAKRGMMFTNAYAANPLCSPTRASIMTGLFPARIGITTPSGHLKEEVLEQKLPAKAAPHQKLITPNSVTRLKQEYYTLAEARARARASPGARGRDGGKVRRLLGRHLQTGGFAIHTTL